MGKDFITTVCSNKPRPSVHTGINGGQFKTGECLWGRDVFHAALDRQKTICGVDCSEWLIIGHELVEDVLKRDDFCKSCAIRVRP